MGLPSPSITTLRRWSADDGWVAAAKEFDAKTQIAPLEQMPQILLDNARHATTARMMQHYGEQVFKARLFDPETNQPREGFAFEDEKVGDAIRAIDIGIRLERLAAGMSSDRIDVLNMAYRVIVDGIGPVFLRTIDGILQIAEGWPEEYRVRLRNKIDEARMSFGLEVDGIVEAEFSPYLPKQGEG
jgi:hypothetical protein